MGFGYNPQVRAAEERLERLARRSGITFTVTSRFRSISKQIELFRRFKAGKSRFPVAVPGLSTHNYGVSFDAVSNDAAALGRLAPEAGLVWAGPRDRIHFQFASQRDWSTALTRSGVRALATDLSKTL